MCTVSGRKYSRECYLRRSAQQLLVFRIYILYNSLLQYTLDSHLSADQIATLIVSSQDRHYSPKDPPIKTLQDEHPLCPSCLSSHLIPSPHHNSRVSRRTRLVVYLDSSLAVVWSPTNLPIHYSLLYSTGSPCPPKKRIPRRPSSLSWSLTRA